MSILSFGLNAFSSSFWPSPWSVEGAYWYLQMISLGLIALTIFSSLGAIVMGIWASTRQSAKLLGLEKEVADARTKQVNAERALLELQEESKPRHFTKQQVEQFSQTLRNAVLESGLKDADRTPLELVYMDKDWEAATFAYEIKRALELGSLKADVIRPVDIAFMLSRASGNLFGITIVTNTAKMQKVIKFKPKPLEADILQKAFAEIGFTTRLYPQAMPVRSLSQKMPIFIFVGAKPNALFNQEQTKEREELQKQRREAEQRRKKMSKKEDQ
jgi:hypothetical protein